MTAQYLLRATFTCYRCILIKQGVEAELASVHERRRHSPYWIVSFVEGS